MDKIIVSRREARAAYRRNGDEVPENLCMSRAATWPVAMLGGLVCWVALFRAVFG